MEGGDLGAERAGAIRNSSDDKQLTADPVSVLRRSGSVVLCLKDIAEARPDAVAIWDQFKGRSVTFAELEASSNLIASNLADRIGPGDQRVALAVDQDVDFIINAFGIMKAGKTQVPLDLQNPPDRLTYILGQSGASLIVADEATWDRVEPLAHSGYEAVSIGDLAKEGASTASLLAPARETVARIMYTSGSSGNPKGVVHTHNYLATKMASDIDFFQFGPSDRVGGLFPQAFAASTAFTFGALLAGATVCPYDVAARGIHPLAGWIQDAQITASAMVPTLLRRFIRLMSAEASLESIRLVMTGGELMTPGDVELFQKRFPASTQLIHQLAATECGPIARFVFDGSTPFLEPVVPAGAPAPGRRVLVVDRAGNELPAGETGEMIVVGGQIASGYWADPERTAEAFGVDSEGDRFYRTGDAGRIDTQGRLVHMGRLDARIKVRGYGVDLREVEQALVALDGVSEAVVSTADADGDVSLIAHVTTLGPLDERSLRRQLGERLPTYMVPSSYVWLDEMPLTPRGKIDRRALPPPDATPSEEDRVLPDNEVEGTLLRIWEQTLGQTGIGVTDDFFSLGGTSVQAFEMFARIAAELGRDLPPTTLLDCPTVRTLAEAVESEEVGEIPTFLVPISRDGSKNPLWVVHGGGGYVLWAQDIAAGLDQDRPVIGIQPRPMDGKSEYLRLVEEMAASYLGELRTVQPEGPYYLAGYSFGGLVAYEMAQQLGQIGESVALLALLDPHPDDTEAVFGPKGVGDRYLWHRERLARGGLTDKLGYVGLLLRRRQRAVMRRLRTWRATRYRARGGYVPPNYRKAVFTQLAGHARESYQRRPYPGSVTLITSGSHADAQRLAWGDYALGGLDLVELEVTHLGMVSDEEEIKLVTEALDARLRLAGT